MVTFCGLFCAILNHMHLVYRTGIAALVQFIVMSILSFANNLTSVITTCHDDKGACVSNLLVSLILFLLLATWFGAIWVLATSAQQRRSKRIAQLLILVEVMVIGFALVNLKLHSGKLSIFTSATDIVLSCWVIVLAYRLTTANGGRIVRRRVRNS